MFIIKLNPYSIIKREPINGPVARPIFDINPANAATCPCLSKDAHKPKIYGIVNPHAIPVTEFAMKYIVTFSE